MGLQLWWVQLSCLLHTFVLDFEVIFAIIRVFFGLDDLDLPILRFSMAVGQT